MTETKVEQKSFLEKLGNIPNRIIFAVIMILVIIPLIFPVILPINISAETQMVYAAIDAIQPGDYIRICSGVSPYAPIDMGYTIMAILRQLWSKEGPNGEHVRIVFVSWTGNSEYLDLVIRYAIGSDWGTKIKYGIDYVNLGNVLAMTDAGFATLARDAWAAVSYDFYGTPLANIPLAAHVKGWNMAQFKLNICNTGGTAHSLGQIVGYFLPYFPDLKTNALFMGDSQIYSFWVGYAHAGFIRGITNGVFTAAELEKLEVQKGIKLQAMYANATLGPYNLVNLFVIFLIVIGNISYFATRKKVK